MNELLTYTQRRKSSSIDVKRKTKQNEKKRETLFDFEFPIRTEKEPYILCSTPLTKKERCVYM